MLSSLSALVAVAALPVMLPELVIYPAPLVNDILFVGTPVKLAYAR